MKCPDHKFETMDLIDWLPPKGLGPCLRKFKCPNCELVLYKRPTGFESMQEEKVESGSKPA